jgi:hypothetical protein
VIAGNSALARRSLLYRLPREAFKPSGQTTAWEEIKKCKYRSRTGLRKNGYKPLKTRPAEFSELDDLYPALCSEDCHVKPDGVLPRMGRRRYCSHSG